MKKILKKIFILIIISSMILTLFITPVISQQNENYTNKLISIRVIDTIEGKNTKYYITSDEFQKFIEIMYDRITVSYFSQKMSDKLSLLKDYGVVSDKTIKTLLSRYNLDDAQINRFNGLPKPSVSNVINIFSGTFFGIKGEKTSSFLELSVMQLPFFNGNITAGLIGYNKFIGNGSIFTVGFIGLKYIYDFNSDEYGFPYFPVITGIIVGFSGILIEVKAQHPDIPKEMKGNYYIGVGMSIFSYWKI